MTTRSDSALAQAIALVSRTLAAAAPRPQVTTFFDEATFTASHVVRDPGGAACAIIDSVLDFDPASGCTRGDSAQRLIDHVAAHALRVEWLLETHAHADHLTAAPLLHRRLGGTLAIGQQITAVQESFARLLNEGTDFARDGSQFGHLFADGETFRIGGLDAIALHVPGHTPACVAYVVGDAVFVGDTLFMPDLGTARCDFPGGSARELYRSIRRLLALPEATRVFMCHDYKAPGRESYAWETTIGAERAGNVHVREGVDEAAFVAMREARDATLPVPRLILPAIQVNMRAGHFPAAEGNGVRYLKLPVDAL